MPLQVCYYKFLAFDVVIKGITFCREMVPLLEMAYL